MATDSKVRLLTKDFALVTTGNFFVFLCFYALMPLLPFYLQKTFAVSESSVGLILAGYMFTCIFARPIAGNLLDNYSRRKIYLISYTFFALCFAGYAFACGALLFFVIRAVHGLFFGSSTVSSSTLISQVVPRSRVGEGLGYYGLSNTLAMCIGPLLGLTAVQYFSYDRIFLILSSLGMLGIIVAASVKIPPRPAIAPRKLNLENLFISAGTRAFLTVLLLAIPYGCITNYVAVYACELELADLAGWYFTMMAAGLVIARPIAGKKADQGHVLQLIVLCLALAAVSHAALWITAYTTEALRDTIFLAAGFVQGIAFGIMHPSFNSFMIKLAPENRRGSATSMFLTAFDLGIGLGALTAGSVARLLGGFSGVYLIGAFLSLASLASFVFITRPHYLKIRHSLRQF